jgi:hypothetical protein
MKKNVLIYFVKEGGHVTLTAILDFRIFPVKIIFSTEIHGQTSDKKQPLFYLYRHLLLKKL